MTVLNSIYLTCYSNGQLTSKTDNKGNRTTYIYNSRGLETSRTEAAGTPQARTITTDWHPTLFLPVTVTEPTRITTYTYDACSGLLNLDTFLGENTRQTEVSHEQATPYLFR
jgi:YD repeat-containing protein